MIDSFPDLVRLATGFGPYAYQQQLADQGLPEVLEAPTGAGKTIAAVLPWLWRRRFHPDPAVRSATPRRLVFALPMRVLVEQTAHAVRGWLDNLDLADVRLAVLLGGERPTQDWRRVPESDAVVIGTTDMLLSRALNRGYGESRYAWPLSFGLLSNDAHWVFDEVQLMGAGLPTSRQLQALREVLGTACPTSSTWMSATVPWQELATVDRPEIGQRASVGPDDRGGTLGERLAATRTIRRVANVDGTSTETQHANAVADAALAIHQPGTRTLVVQNTVRAARETFAKLHRRAPEPGPQLVLLHSRFRPRERAERLTEALADIDEAGAGRIVVTTQVVEAGVDVSSAALLTEACPWPSLVQRAGRCNRYAEHPGAVLAWFPPRRPAPYPEADVEATTATLEALEGRALTGEELAAQAVHVTREPHPVLRRVDLVELFDTAPDLTGADVDVSVYVRDVEDVDAAVAWRHVPDDAPDPDTSLPARDERCPVPANELESFLGGNVLAWRYDHLAERWLRARRGDARPGAMVLVRADQGGYDPRTGWDPRSSADVPVVETATDSEDEEAQQGMRADPLAFIDSWVPLSVHLRDTERCASELARLVEGGDVPAGAAEAVVRGGLLHDLGKAHEVFQETMARAASMTDEPEESVARAGLWAKAGGKRVRHRTPHFRHELAGALALLSDAGVLLKDLAEPDLVRYLVAAHHGRVRVAIRSVPGELNPDDPQRPVALGVADRDELPAIDLGDGLTAPASTLRLAVAQMGADPEHGLSWGARMLALRDRSDVGPFRLALLEGLVRVADWRASAEPSHTVADPMSAEAIR